jgi:hypothetical protein
VDAHTMMPDHARLRGLAENVVGHVLSGRWCRRLFRWRVWT